MDAILNRLFRLPWLRKPASVFLVLIGSVTIFYFLKEVSWTFFLFLNQDTFAKYILNYQGPFKFFQQLKNDEIIYFSWSEALPYVLPIMVVIGVLSWVHYKIQNSKSGTVTKLRNFLYKEYTFLIWINFFIFISFSINFIGYSRVQYVRSVNEFIHFKVWMAEHGRNVNAGCVYYPMLNKTFYFDIDSVDFVSHFTGYSLSPLSETLKDVLSITPDTPVFFDLSLCDSNSIDLNKNYSGKDVVRLMSEYAESCGKRNIIKELKMKFVNAPIRIEKKGNTTIMSVNYKPFAVVDFKCSKDSRELLFYRGDKILTGQ